MKISKTAKNSLIACLILTTLSFCLVSCSKKSEESVNNDGALGGRLVQRIPANSLFFFANNSSVPSYKALKASPLFSTGLRISNSLEEALKSSPDEGQKAEKSKQVIESLKKAGIIPSSEKSEDLFEESILFGAPLDGKLALGIYASAVPGKDLTSALSTLIDAFKQLDLDTQEERFPSLKGYRIRLSETLGSGSFEFAYAAASKEKLAIGTDKKLVEQLFQENIPSGLLELRKRPVFQEAVKGIANLSDSYAAGFIDLPKAIEIAASIPSMQEAVAELRTLPLDALLLSSSFDKSLASDFSIVVNSKNPDQQKWLAALSSGSSHDLLNKLPSDLFLYVGLDGKALKNLAETARENSPEAQAMLEKEPADKINEIALGMQPSISGSPFPDVLFALDSEEPQKLIKSVEETLGGLLGATGLPVTQWSQKKVEGNDIRFINSPMGIGVYLAQMKNIALIASTEIVLRDALKSAAGQSGRLGVKLGQKMQEYVKKTRPAALLYLDFGRAAEILESLEGTLAAFSGGASQFDKAQIDELKKMGVLTVAASYTVPVVKVHTELQAPEKIK